ncbi:putative nucleotidyltransferase [Pseudomonas phage Achelous]|uniref:Putative nucleotidyltransferase n=1 Tax=Pseudomonas phage Achelous TaxID=2163982 RepID=A0A2S1GMS3_9CAUD|nr:nucleotidyltransferase [Pseudomonas phage Achelous]AWD90691.1 putative nucleotidyltransferase [Pseudomonas phage Achelous]
MNSHNAVLLRNAHQVLDTLLLSGVQGVICGGFARDVQYHHNAKDIDIAIGCADMSVSDLADVVELLDSRYSCKVYWTGEEVDGEQLDDPRDPSKKASEPTEKDHKVLLVVSLRNLDVDLVFYNVENDATTLVEQHDCNLNQFVMAGSTPVFLGLFHPDKHGLRITKEGLHPDRISYMERKWEAFNPTEQPVQDDFDKFLDSL